MVGDQRIRDLALALQELRWSWTEDEIPVLARDFGWTVTGDFDGVIEMDGGLGPASVVVDVDDNGTVDMVTISLTSFIDRHADQERAWLQDQFAHAADVMKRALGDPTERRPGNLPEVRWRGPDSTVGLTRTTVRVNMYFTLNQKLDADDLEEEE